MIESKWISASVAVVVGLLALASGPIEGQTCWRGQPQPRCRLSVITEAGPRIGTAEPYDPLGYAVGLGVMFNGRVAQTSFGAAVDVSTSKEGGTYLLTTMPRVRRWLNESVALDAGAGIAFLGPGDSPVGFKGGSALAALNYRDLVLLTLAVNHESGRNDIPARTSVSIGVRFASYCGPPAALASLLIGAAASGGSS